MFNNAEIRSVLSNLRGYYSVAAAFSLAINLLYLAGPLYMLQVYDRVMSSGSLVTLTMLSLILLVSYAALVLLDGVRSRILNRAGLRIDALLSRRVMMAALERPELRSQPMRDLDTVRFFATGAGVQALFDVPWIPIYLIVLFLLHSAVGIFALCGMAALVLLAGLNEVVLKRSLSQSGDAANRNYAFTDVSMRNSDSVRAMGMAEGLLTRWSEDRDRMLHAQVVASDRGGVLSGAIKYLRMSMQSMVLAVGAYLVIERLAAGGIMFASNMLLGRALQPVEQLVGNWRNFVNARDALARLTQLLESVPAEKPALTLPIPHGKLIVDNVAFVAPNSNRPILQKVGFTLEAGEVLGIIGPSSAGKSTLARILMGILPPTAGTVRLDGANITQWPKTHLGRYLGYLPQEVELFPESVAANICRFERVDDHLVIEAAKLAGVHELILQLPQGYDTIIGPGGTLLSGGYRQRIGLARAVYGMPKFVLLDEPSSNLDAVGDQALGHAIHNLRANGTTVIIISHRSGTIASVDKLLLLKDGQVEAFGDRQSIMNRFTAPTTPQKPAQPVKVINVKPPAAAGQGGQA